MKNLKIFSLFLLIVSALHLGGCGDDDTTTNPPSGTAPTLDMRVGSVYIYNIDSLPVSGGAPITTRLISYDTIKAKGTFNGQNDAYQITATLKDTLFPSIPLGTTTYYVRYDGGKFYQYGVLSLISPTIPPSWDLVADFNVSQGTSFDIALGVAIPNITGATANITGIVSDTAFNAAGFGNVNCFRSGIVADIILGISVGKVYVDYYIGDADPSTNPSGSVRVKLRPVNIAGIITQTGVDKRLQRFTPGP